MAQIITISPKGQITIPVGERKKVRSNKLLFEVQRGVITLRPVKIVPAEEAENFSSLAQTSLMEVWDNAQDDVYDTFYT